MVKIVASGVEILPPKNTTKTYDHKPFTAWKRKTPIYQPTREHLQEALISDNSKSLI